MLLNRDLGNMVDLVVDIVANMLDNRGGGNSSWSSDSVTSSNEAMSVGGNTSYKAVSVGGNTSYKAMSIGASKELSISLSISNWSSKATGNDSREDNKGLH